MPPEMIDFLTNLQLRTQAYLNAHDTLARTFQEGIDRGYAPLLATLEFPLPGDLDHLDEGEIDAAFAAFAALDAAMVANGRANAKALTNLVRSWTR